MCPRIIRNGAGAKGGAHVARLQHQGARRSAHDRGSRTAPPRAPSSRGALPAARPRRLPWQTPSAGPARFVAPWRFASSVTGSPYSGQAAWEASRADHRPLRTRRPCQRVDRAWRLHHRDDAGRRLENRPHGRPLLCRRHCRAGCRRRQVPVTRRIRRQDGVRRSATSGDTLGSSHRQAWRRGQRRLSRQWIPWQDGSGGRKDALQKRRHALPPMALGCDRNQSLLRRPSDIRDTRSTPSVNTVGQHRRSTLSVNTVGQHCRSTL